MEKGVGLGMDIEMGMGMDTEIGMGMEGGLLMEMEMEMGLGLGMEKMGMEMVGATHILLISYLLWQYPKTQPVLDS